MEQLDVRAQGLSRDLVSHNVEALILRIGLVGLGVYLAVYCTGPRP